MQAILKKKRNWHFAQIEPCWAVCNLILGTYNKIQLQTQPKGLFLQYCKPTKPATTTLK